MLPLDPFMVFLVVIYFYEILICCIFILKRANISGHGTTLQSFESKHCTYRHFYCCGLLKALFTVFAFNVAVADVVFLFASSNNAPWMPGNFRLLCSYTSNWMASALNFIPIRVDKITCDSLERKKHLEAGLTIVTRKRNITQRLLGATCCAPLDTVLRRVATCWTNLAKRVQHQATSTNVAWKFWPFSNLSQRHPTCRTTSQQGGQTPENMLR